MQVDAGFNIPCPTTVSSLKGKVNDAEWAMRVQLAATYRLCAMHGWTDLVFTHISARLPDAAGFTIHSAVHLAREDAGCVIHVHTPYGMAVSAQKKGLRRYTQMAMQVYDDLAYHDYETMKASR